MPRLSNLDDVRARLERDRHWSAFSLADLDQPYAAHAHWFGLPAGDDVVLVYDAFDPPIVFIQGADARCEAVLAEAEVVAATQSAWLNVQPAHLPLVTRVFSSFESREMVRMVLERDDFVPMPHPGVVPLGPPDLDEVLRFYADEAPSFFLPSQLHDGVYVGIRDETGLVSIAGTHVLSETTSVGALGNVHTRADHRGRRLAGAATGAVVQALFDRGIQTVVLNIIATNEAARVAYERVGFREYCRYFEGPAVRSLASAGS